MKSTKLATAALAVHLTMDFGVLVQVKFDRDERRYRCSWTNGPTAYEMREWASRYSELLWPLNLAKMTWKQNVTDWNAPGLPCRKGQCRGLGGAGGRPGDR